MQFHPAQQHPAEARARQPARPPRAARRSSDAAALQPDAEPQPRQNASGLNSWAGALVRTHVAEKLQVVLGGDTSPAATYEDVLRWRPHFLPYQGASALPLPAFREQASGFALRPPCIARAASEGRLALVSRCSP